MPNQFFERSFKILAEWLNKVDLLATVNNTATSTTTRTTIKSGNEVKMFASVFEDLRIGDKTTHVTRRKLTVRKADHFWEC